MFASAVALSKNNLLSYIVLILMAKLCLVFPTVEIMTGSCIFVRMWQIM